MKPSDDINNPASTRHTVARGVSLENGEDSCTLRLTGPIDIGSAAELRNALLQGFEGGRRFCVSIEDSCTMDLTALQLLWAAKQQAVRVGIAFAIVDQPPQQVTNLLKEMGMERLDIFA